MLMVILQKMHAIKKESKAISVPKMKKKINFVSWVKENRKKSGFSLLYF